jgi:hypothetical protein
MSGNRNITFLCGLLVGVALASSRADAGVASSHISRHFDPVDSGAASVSVSKASQQASSQWLPSANHKLDQFVDKVVGADAADGASVLVDLDTETSVDSTDLSVASEVSEPATWQSLPPAPSGAAMTMTGLLMLAGLRYTRSVKDLTHLGHLPDWYHSNAPEQVRHIMAFDLQFAPAVVSFLDEPDIGRSFSVRSVQPVTNILTPQYVVPADCPRGPPALVS